MKLSGALFIGAERVTNAPVLNAFNPNNEQLLPVDFSTANETHVDLACKKASLAYTEILELPLSQRAKFLDTIADNILGLGDALLERAHLETGLPMARLTGERGRTIGQLKLFANEIRDGAWMGLRIDPAQPKRAPMPRSDLRLRKIGLGPVAVFGASNFPLAFSVAGGDTASALAAGCPVVVKGHGAHLGTSEYIASAIIDAVKSCGMPDGTFSLINGSGRTIGQALVSHPLIKAVGFTGSRQGGTALMKTAAERPNPIPVYAEMSAVNPVIILPGALKKQGEALANEFVGSLSMGAGQFCTNPGLVFGLEGPDLNAFIETASKAVQVREAQTMLTAGIQSAYTKGIDQLSTTKGVDLIAQGPEGDTGSSGRAALFATSLQNFESESAITEEVFGASSVVVKCKSEASLLDAIGNMEGQLTATLHIDKSDYPLAKKLLPKLEQIAGRVIFNGWPTGVEVSHTMVHGGPTPATSDPRSTSVGSLAIDRFVRPVCYQDTPDALLPDVLKGQGAAGVMTRYDGKWIT